MAIAIWVILGLLLLCGGVVLRGAPYVPSKKRDIALAFDELYKLSEKDTLVDIGSGDGVVLRLAAKKGARAVGYEINPLLVLVSRFLSRQESDIVIKWADFWLSKLPDDTTVVYTFGESRHITKMLDYVQREAIRLNKNLYLISYGFEVPDKKYYKRSSLHFMYRLEPLQSDLA